MAKVKREKDVLAVIKQAVAEVFEEKGVATKRDLNDYATKDYLDLKLDQKKDEIIDEFKKFRSDFYEKIDPILKEVKDNREERTIQADHLKNHGDRIEKLEKIHPQGRHLATL